MQIPCSLTGDVINVGCGIQISVNDLAHRVAHFLSRPDLKPDHLPERAGDLKHSFADLNHARAILNYEPVVGFEPGLEATLGWYAKVL